MKLIHKISAAFGGAGVLLLAAVLISAWWVREVEKTARWNTHTFLVLNAAEQMQRALAQAEMGQRGYLLTGEDRYLKLHSAAHEEYGPQLSALRRLTSDNPEQQRRLEQVEPLAEAKFAILAEAVELRRNGDEEGAMVVVRSGRGFDLMDEINKLMSGFTQVEKGLLKQRDERFEAGIRKLTVVIAIAAALAIVFAALGAIAIRREGRRQLRLVEQARDQSQNIIATIREPFLVLDSQMRVETANPAFYDLFQTSPKETKGHALFDLEQGKWNIPILREQLSTVIPNDTKFEGLQVEAEFGKAGRRILILNARKVYRPGNHTGRLLLAMEDVTERRLAQAEIDRFFALSLDMLCIASADGYFKRVSPAFTRTLGWSEEELLTRPYLEFVHPDDRKATLNEVKRQVILGESVLKFESRHRHKDGSWRILSWKSSPEFGGLMFAVARDVTERRKAEATLKQTNEELERRVHERTAQLETSNAELQREVTDRRRAEEALQVERAQLARRVAERTADLSAANAELARASRLKSEFLANMSHELRTPLNAVLGLSESLLEQRSGPLTERQIRSIITIESSGRHLLSLINDVLDVSKVEAGKLELELEEVEAREICEASIQLVRQQAVSKRQTIQFTCEIDARPLHADSRRLKQILVNLLGNAVKFTPEGGRIGLEVIGDAAAGCITFTVWDNGIGIAPEDQPRLFQPFVQVQSALSREYEGTGLGLILVQRLAELHGGSVKLESAPGQGSRFIIRLPWDHASLVSGPRPAPRHQPLDGVHSAMIIEDAQTAYEQLERYLSELHVRSVIHECGKGAMERAAEVNPDVILLDILLPDISGWEVLRQLKSDSASRIVGPVGSVGIEVSVRGKPSTALTCSRLIGLTR